MKSESAKIPGKIIAIASNKWNVIMMVNFISVSYFFKNYKRSKVIILLESAIHLLNYVTPFRI